MSFFWFCLTQWFLPKALKDIGRHTFLFCFTCKWPWGYLIHTGEKVVENRSANIFKKHLGCWIGMHLGKDDDSASQLAITSAGSRSKRRQQRILCMLMLFLKIRKNHQRFAFFFAAFVRVSDEVSEKTAKLLDPQFTITGDNLKKFVIVDKIDLPVTITLSGKLGVYAIENVEKLEEIEKSVVRVSEHFVCSDACN